MIQIDDKRKCTGCGACATACPLNLIEMSEDKEGFLYPFVDVSKCVNCGKCEKVCHLQHDVCKGLDKLENREYYAAVAKDKSILKEVSSGGAAWVIASRFVSEAGIVYGASMDENLEVKHIRVEKADDLNRIKRSKYLQSNTNGIFENVKADLAEGRKVLFTGTPCQIAGLYSYLGKDYENLLTIDIVCHGVPSSYMFRKYIEEIEKKERSSVSSIIFRDKSYGWSDNHYNIEFKNGKHKSQSSVIHPFHGVYLLGLISRPSCGECKYTRFPRVGDITVADYWKYSGELKKSNDNQGISLVVLNTDKAKVLLDITKDYLETDISTEESVLDSCRHLTHTPMENEKRAEFFDAVGQYGYLRTAKKYIPLRSRLYTLYRKVKGNG